jgi:18S rRNA (guanine1575-N7)-methyltransferase
LGTEEHSKDEVAFEKKREKVKRGRAGAKNKNGVDKDWILKKKSLYRQRGKEGVPNDSKWVIREILDRFRPGRLTQLQIHRSQAQDEILR